MTGANEQNERLPEAPVDLMKRIDRAPGRLSGVQAGVKLPA